MIVVAVLLTVLAPVTSSAAPVRGPNEQYAGQTELEKITERIRIIGENSKATALERYRIYDEYLMALQKYGHPIEDVNRDILENLRSKAAREGFAGDIDAFMREVVGEGKDNTKGPTVTIEDYDKTIKRKEKELQQKTSARETLNVKNNENFSSQTSAYETCFDAKASQESQAKTPGYPQIAVLKPDLPAAYKKVCVEIRTKLHDIAQAEYQIKKLEAEGVSALKGRTDPTLYKGPTYEADYAQGVEHRATQIAAQRKGIETLNIWMKHWEGELKKLTAEIGFLNFEITALVRDIKELKENRTALFGSGATTKKKATTILKDCVGNLEKSRISDLKKMTAKHNAALKKAKSLGTAKARLDAKKKADAAYTTNMKAAAKQLTAAKLLCKKTIDKKFNK